MPPATLITEAFLFPKALTESSKVTNQEQKFPVLFFVLVIFFYIFALQMFKVEPCVILQVLIFCEHYRLNKKVVNLTPVCIHSSVNISYQDHL